MNVCGGHLAPRCSGERAARVSGAATAVLVDVIHAKMRSGACRVDAVAGVVDVARRGAGNERRPHSLLGSPAPPTAERARSIFKSDL